MPRYLRAGFWQFRREEVLRALFPFFSGVVGVRLGLFLGFAIRIGSLFFSWGGAGQARDGEVLGLGFYMLAVRRRNGGGDMDRDNAKYLEMGSCRHRRHKLRHRLVNGV